MARIRTVKPEFWASEQVMECSPITRLLFIGLWNFCDDAGNHVDSEKTVKAEIFPGDDISSVDVRRMLDELSSNGLISYYTSNSKAFLHVLGWKHQKIERPSFKHPDFPGDLSPIDRRLIADNSPPEGKGREGKGREKEQSSLRSDSSSAEPTTLTLTEPTPKPSPADLAARRVQRLSTITEDAIEAYNRLMAKPIGRLAAVNAKVGRKTRLKQVDRCLQTASEICEDQFSDKKITPEFWEMYFSACLEDDFTSGAGPYTGQHANWRPDFEYLTRPATMLKTFERATNQEAAA